MVAGRPVGLGCAAVLVGVGGEDHFVSPAFGGLADDVLVVAPAVHVGAVGMVDADVDGVMEQADRFRVVRRAVDAGERHAAEADGAD